MNDAHFPSGPWTGFFNYTAGGTRHRMDLSLSFAQGQVSGEGRDSVGTFVIAGRYDAAARECYWTKTYVGAHDVFYAGFGEGNGIWGTWEIETIWRGGFHIWPLGEHGGETVEKSAERPAPGEIVRVGQ